MTVIHPASLHTGTRRVPILVRGAVPNPMRPTRQAEGHGEITSHPGSPTLLLRVEPSTPASVVLVGIPFADKDAAGQTGGQEVASLTIRHNCRETNVVFIHDGQEPQSTPRKYRVWAGFKYPNVSQFRDVHGNPVYISTPKYPCFEAGNVVKYLEVNKDVDQLAIVNGVAKGLRYLHEYGIVHGDLKTKNILVGPGCTPVICGFENAEKIGERGDSSAIAGSVPYMAPEYFIGGDEGTAQVPVTKAANIYSLGMVILEILTGRTPFYYCPVESRVIWLVCRGRRPSRAKYHIPMAEDALWRLLEACWAQAPESRPGIDDVIQRLTFIHDTNTTSL